jgi:hypothetical protein
MARTKKVEKEPDIADRLLDGLAAEKLHGLTRAAVFG